MDGLDFRLDRLGELSVGTLGRLGLEGPVQGQGRLALGLERIDGAYD